MTQSTEGLPFRLDQFLGSRPVGRRRERQRLVPALRDGDTTFAVITGIGGAGKSTLATRAANCLESAGFRVVPVRVERDKGPIETGASTLTRLIGALDDAFIQSGAMTCIAR